MARDAGSLVYEQSYLLEAVSLIDMFSHTDHVELVSEIKNASKNRYLRSFLLIFMNGIGTRHARRGRLGSHTC